MKFFRKIFRNKRVDALILALQKKEREAHALSKVVDTLRSQAMTLRMENESLKQESESDEDLRFAYEEAKRLIEQQRTEIRDLRHWCADKDIDIAVLQGQLREARNRPHNWSVED